jgi:hypothetical protein
VVGEVWIGSGVHPAADVLEHTVKTVGAAVGDDVEDVARGFTILRGEGVRDGLNLLDEDVADGEKTEANPVALGIHHSVHLIVNAVEKTIGIETAGNAKFGIGVATDSGLKDDEVVWVT